MDGPEFLADTRYVRFFCGGLFPFLHPIEDVEDDDACDDDPCVECDRLCDIAASASSIMDNGGDGTDL